MQVRDGAFKDGCTSFAPFPMKSLFRIWIDVWLALTERIQQKWSWCWALGDLQLPLSHLWDTSFWNPAAHATWGDHGENRVVWLTAPAEFPADSQDQRPTTRASHLSWAVPLDESSLCQHHVELSRVSHVLRHTRAYKQTSDDFPVLPYTLFINVSSV